MSLCPHASLLNLANFDQGTPRTEIARLRENHRIVWQDDEINGGGHWLVLHRDDIDQVLKTPADFTNNFGPLLEDFPEEFLAEQQQSLTFMDPPQHRNYRALADYAFRPKALEKRLPVMQRMASDIVDAVAHQSECEFVEDVAMQLPNRVMFTLLGVPETDYQKVVDLTQTLTLSSDPDYASDRMEGFMASMELMVYGEQLADDHRINPRDSMTMDMLNSDIEGRTLTSREFGRFFVNLIVGGVETTRNTLAWLFYELAQHPEQYASLRSDLSLVPNAVEEALRLHNTVIYLRRTATRAMNFAGESIGKGDKLVCVLGSVSRNPEYFEGPDLFNIHRDAAVTRRNYRTFGAGPHFCIGVHQARMNLEVMTAELVRRFSDLTVLEDPVHFRSNFMDGFKRMRLGYTLAE